MILFTKLEDDSIDPIGKPVERAMFPIAALALDNARRIALLAVPIPANAPERRLTTVLLIAFDTGASDPASARTNATIDDNAPVALALAPRTRDMPCEAFPVNRNAPDRTCDIVPETLVDRKLLTVNSGSPVNARCIDRAILPIGPTIEANGCPSVLANDPTGELVAVNLRDTDFRREPTRAKAAVTLLPVIFAPGTARFNVAVKDFGLTVPPAGEIINRNAFIDEAVPVAAQDTAGHAVDVLDVKAFAVSIILNQPVLDPLPLVLSVYPVAVESAVVPLDEVTPITAWALSADGTSVPSLDTGELAFVVCRN
jgi:hypothetical protein